MPHYVSCPRLWKFGVDRMGVSDPGNAHGRTAKALLWDGAAGGQALAKTAALLAWDTKRSTSCGIGGRHPASLPWTSTVYSAKRSAWCSPRIRHGPLLPPPRAARSRHEGGARLAATSTRCRRGCSGCAAVVNAASPVVLCAQCRLAPGTLYRLVHGAFFYFFIFVSRLGVLLCPDSAGPPTAGPPTGPSGRPPCGLLRSVARWGGLLAVLSSCLVLRRPGSGRELLALGV